MEENKLLMIEDVNGENPTWYFTNVQKAANWFGIQRTYLIQCLGKKNPSYKNYRLEWIDGTDIIYKYINPER